MITKPFKIRKKEFRSAEVRGFNADTNTFSAIACVYGVVDDYGTRFVEGCFDSYMEERLPTFCWSHDWSEPIGRVLSASSKDLGDGTRGWVINVQLDAVPSVPRAMQAAYQLQSKTLTDVSVGFCRTGSQEAEDMEGVTDITGAECDEVSVVIVGAVPGAKVLMSRAGKTQYVDAEIAGNILTRLQQGQIDLHEALGELKEKAVEGEPDEDAKADDSDDTDVIHNDGGDGKVDGDVGDGDGADKDGKVDELDEADIEAALALVQ